MARWAFVPPAFTWPSVNDPAPYRANVTNLRNTFRDGWGVGFTTFNDDLAPTSRFKVSDIGTYVTGGFEGMYFFILRDITNNSEFLFTVSGRDASTSPSEYSDYWGDGTSGTGNTYEQVVSQTAVSAGGQNHSYPGIGVYYNPDYATSSMTRSFGFNDTTNLTYTGGDFTSVTTPPLTDSDVLNNWLPVGGVKYPKGFIFYSNISSIDPMTMMFILDDALDTMAIYQAGGSNDVYLVVTEIALLGRSAILPYIVTDTYTQGGVWWSLAPSDGNLGTHTYAYANGFSEAGTRIHDYAHQYYESYTHLNQVDGSGNIKWRTIPLSSASDTAKGTIHPDLALEIGAYNSFSSMPGTIYNLPSAAAPMMKYTASAATMYAQSLPRFPFPFFGWGSNMEVAI